jgi:hypothetical protein
LIKDQMDLSEETTAAIQIGRSVISFTVKSIDLPKQKMELKEICARKDFKNFRKGLAEVQEKHDKAQKRGNSVDTREHNLMAFRGHQTELSVAQFFSSQAQPG